jgi:hypothetical protein
MILPSLVILSDSVDDRRCAVSLAAFHLPTLEAYEDDVPRIALTFDWRRGYVRFSLDEGGRNAGELRPEESDVCKEARRGECSTERAGVTFVEGISCDGVELTPAEVRISREWLSPMI